ncbi:MAG: Coenzyme F420 hydrogenase/dehydrogenase, beta subunit C-terminal domain [Sneathiella sp.]|nr:Coenzyme F420 hydrogenase/dehydrogenase, beta subunit C-terminal domain [Sneathiella sp.]
MCAFVEPDRFYIEDAYEYGRRPFLTENPSPETGAGLRHCPGINQTHDFEHVPDDLDKNLMDGWGPILDVWEGHATDPDVRFKGSSGGAATALANWAVHEGEFAGVLHTGPSESSPIYNEAIYSKTLDELKRGCGSRYAPASPCEGLSLLSSEDGAKSVFIGKPCDVSAVQKLRKSSETFNQQIGLTIAFFCAGTPSSKGITELMKRQGIAREHAIHEVRYRGHGWPGKWFVKYDDLSCGTKEQSLTYAESWDFLQRYRQWRCYICPDHTGEFADIAVGDPWYREISEEEPGKSLIIARTEKGREAILAAAAAGYITLESNDSSLLPKSQPNILAARGALWARILVLRLFGVPVPTYSGFKLYRFWWSELSFKEKLRSFSGTLKRIFVKRLKGRISVTKNNKILGEDQ